MLKNRSLINSLILCTLFLLNNNSYTKSADERFFERCEQFTCKEECQNLLSNYRNECKQQETDTLQLGKITQKLAENYYGRSCNVENLAPIFRIGIPSDDGLTSEYKEQAKDLIENQCADINAQHFSTILMVACYIKDPTFVQWLVNHGANVNAIFKSPRNTIHTALIEATCAGNTETVAILLNAGADTTIKDNNEKS